MKHMLTLLLLAGTAAWAGAVPTTSTAAVALRVQLPSDPHLDKPLTVMMPSGAPLSTVLTAIAKASGLTVVVRDVPPLPVTVSLKGLTVRAALERLLSLYSDQVAARLVGGTLIVAPPAVIARLEAPQSTTRDVLSLTISTQDAQNIAGLTGATLVPLGDQVIVSGSKQQVADALAILRPAQETATLPSAAQAPQATVRDNLTIGDAAPDVVSSAVGKLGVTVTVAYGRAYLQANSQAELDAAKALVAQLRTDAPQPSAPPPVSQANKDELVRHTVQTSLTAELVGRLATGISEGLKLTPLDQGTYLVRGEASAVEAFEQALKAAATREAMRVVVVYKQGQPSMLGGLKEALPNVSARAVDGGIEVRGLPNEQVLASTYIARLFSALPASQQPEEQVTVRVGLGYASPETVSAQLLSLYAPLAKAEGGTATAEDAAAPSSAAPAAAPPAAPSAGGANNAMSGSTTIMGVRIVPDIRTRSLLLSGPASTVSKMQKTVADLDIRVPDVRMALHVEQVTGSNGQDLGLNWSVGMGGFSVGQSDGTLQAGFQPGLTPFKVTAQLAAARSQGRSKTLLETTFVAQDGVASNFTNGGQMILPTSSTTTTGTGSTGSTTSSSTTTSTFNYGMQLTLTPTLAPDGSVLVNIKLQIGQQPTTGVQNSVIIASQTLNTIATVKPGETVVLGGILQGRDSANSKGVPFLSQIPVLGVLFGKKSDSVSNDVLLITLAAGDRDDSRAPAATTPAK